MERKETALRPSRRELSIAQACVTEIEARLSHGAAVTQLQISLTARTVEFTRAVKERQRVEQANRDLNQLIVVL